MVGASIVCPPAANYAPCDCAENSSLKPGTIILNCASRNLNDTRVSDILDAFLTTPGVSPVTFIFFPNNQLTYVPSQMKRFTQLGEIYFSQNPIASINANDFNFAGSANSFSFLDLSRTRLTFIAPGAFQGKKIIFRTILYN